MSRQIVFHGEYFIDFYKTLDSNVKSKFQYGFGLIKQVKMVPKKSPRSVSPVARGVFGCITAKLC